MKATIQHDFYGAITYEEGFWTGKKTIKINGTPLTKIDKTHYTYVINGEVVAAEIKGNILMGVRMTIQNNVIWLAEKPAWYVAMLSILMFAFIIIWGSSPALCAIFPVVGGAIGGLVSAIFATSNIILAGKTQNPVHKILIGLGCFAATVVICYIIATALLSAVASTF